MIYLQLYLSFLQVGLFSVGGGYAAMPLIRSQVVELHPWMTLQEFTNLITIAEMTPGPIAINCATFVGLRIAQLPGAVIATLGCITPALVLVSLLAWCYRRWRDLSVLQSVLACLRPAVVALILGAGLSILGIVVFPNGILGLGSIDWIGTGSFFAAFILLRKYKWNPILTMCLCGAASLALGAGKLRTTFNGVLPQAISGIVTSIILSIGRIVNESAALIFTVGSASTFVPESYSDGAASFAVLVWKFMSNGLQVNEAYATASVLLVFVIVLNLLVSFVQYLYNKKEKI